MIAVSVSASSISREMIAVTVSPPYLCFSVSNFSVSSLQDIFSVIPMSSVQVLPEVFVYSSAECPAFAFAIRSRKTVAIR
jgi:hypothetical protein